MYLNGFYEISTSFATRSSTHVAKQCSTFPEGGCQHILHLYAASTLERWEVCNEDVLKLYLFLAKADDLKFLF